MIREKDGQINENADLVSILANRLRSDMLLTYVIYELVHVISYMSP